MGKKTLPGAEMNLGRLESLKIKKNSVTGEGRRRRTYIS